MAVINTGIVLRTITGVNESDLFLGSESTSVATNTGIVERSIVDSHDANFVHPIGDEEVLNGDFSNGTTGWSLGTGWSVSDGKAASDGSVAANSFLISTGDTLTIGKTYKVKYTVLDYISGKVKVSAGQATQSFVNADGTYTEYMVASNTESVRVQANSNFKGSIDNISVKEILVNRESTAINTGIVERPITGVNDSDPMFPDNTISNIVNIAGLISSLIADLKARATTFENEDATRNILINLQNC
jgi:hypothetical protein